MKKFFKWLIIALTVIAMATMCMWVGATAEMHYAWKIAAIAVGTIIGLFIGFFGRQQYVAEENPKDENEE